MTRQIAVGTTTPSRAVLEDRIRELEIRTAALAKAVRLLTRALEDCRPGGSGTTPLSEAAREARELLVTC
jgi:hypothetical protein